MQKMVMQFTFLDFVNHRSSLVSELDRDVQAGLLLKGIWNQQIGSPLLPTLPPKWQKQNQM
jgi:hypothetical protein